VTVKVNAVPAVTVVGNDTMKCVAVPTTVVVPVPVIELFTVSVAVIV
jgi:hypothetical protein